ncbi:hypothetical protein ON010_g14155 [Phytophthora cinnamomi]|nr:hypothetical protein ON010_g14155 [Phytophthora cinnamomi]
MLAANPLIAEVVTPEFSDGGWIDGLGGNSSSSVEGTAPPVSAVDALLVGLCIGGSPTAKLKVGPGTWTSGEERSTVGFGLTSNTPVPEGGPLLEELKDGAAHVEKLEAVDW